jgi:glycosyltransferase involved in cell wall biosynthesis
MKICFFGSYERYPLAARLKNLFESKGVEIIECQKDVSTFTQLIKAYFSIWMQHRNKNYSLMIIPWRGIMTLPLAKIVSKGPIMWFPYVAIYDALINDRKKFRKKSIVAKLIRLIEKTACRICDIIVLESNENIDYYCKEYNLSREKFRKFTWAFDNKIFPPHDLKKPTDEFVVLYWGTYIPFHNVEVMIKAAKYLIDKEIKFVFCGEGQTLEENKKMVKKDQITNIKFLGHVKLSVLQKEIANSDVCLGVFADSKIRSYTFASKLWQVLASKKPLITRNVPVMKEIPLINEENCILVESNNPKKIADAIIKLKNNPKLVEKIAMNGYETYKPYIYDRWEEFWNETIKPIIEEEKY